MNRRQWFLRGMRAGVPISLGYFAVAIALGIAAKRAGMPALAAALTSLFTNASAGEYAGFTLIAAHAPYLEVIFMQAVVNIRYLLMSASLSQKLEPNVGLGQRLLLGMTVTDEIFGVSIAVPGKLSPFFSYGCFMVATIGWTGGTLFGAVLGEILSPRIVSALSVGLYGMFISVFLPESRKNRVVAVTVILGFALSFAFSVLPVLREISEGFRVILLTVAISLGAAILFPIKDEEKEEKENA